MNNLRLWQIQFSETAKKQFSKLDKPVQLTIRKFLREKLMGVKNPRVMGKPLKGPLSSFWRYRVGDYRIIVDIVENCLIIQVVQVGHRKDVYH